MVLIGDEWLGNWIEEVEIQISGIGTRCVYPADRPVVVSTGDTENQEIQVSIKTL